VIQTHTIREVLRAVEPINSIGNLAGFVSPYMIGYLKDLT
jgi:hypothetical protein